MPPSTDLFSRIQRLSPALVNKIAAGEVIERPANVVKELLENSIDALATRIDVEIEQGGTELIRVTDDGEGIHPDDVVLAVSSHATSKLRDADDLFRVQTLGFRGEALASVAEVSRLRLRSRPGELLEGAELSVNGGERSELRPCGCPAGTQVEVRQLFFNVPVRRKFLKSQSTEFGHIAEQFTRIALAHPQLQMTLRHNGKPVYELPASLGLGERLEMFFGRELGGQLIEVQAEHDGARLWGYVAPPSHSRANRTSQYLFMNGRWIQDRSLQHALGEAYRGLLMVGRYPMAFLFLEVPAEDVDVNVHPTKAEVRFREPQRLYRLVLSTLRNRFLGMDLSSPLDLEARRAQKQTDVDPALQMQAQQELVAWARDELSGRVAEWSRAEGGEGRAEGGETRDESLTSGAADAFAGERVRMGVEGLSERIFRDELGAGRDGHDATTPSDAPPPPPAHSSLGHSATLPFDHSAPSVAVPGEVVHVKTAESELHPASAAAEVRAMQVHDCYLVLATPNGLTVIDQHALHERILYERLRNRVLAGGVEVQRLLVPVTVDLGPREAALLEEHRDLLHELGLVIEQFGGTTVAISGLPTLLQRAAPEDLVRSISRLLEERGAGTSRRDVLDSLLHLLSCKAAIKAGQRLSPEEISALLAQRHLVADAHHCPHGRPTALTLSREALDRQFGRLG